jgi:H+-transporting ATPase
MLCSDKTGTLTANKLSLNDPYIAAGVDPNWFMTVSPLSLPPSSGLLSVL